MLAGLLGREAQAFESGLSSYERVAYEDPDAWRRAHAAARESGYRRWLGVLSACAAQRLLPWRELLSIPAHVTVEVNDCRTLKSPPLLPGSSR